MLALLAAVMAVLWFAFDFFIELSKSAEKVD